MKKIKIIADKNIPFLKGIFESVAEIQYHEPSVINNSLIKDADVIFIRTRTKCNKELLNNTSVKLIATATTGIDHIDLDYCNKKNIKIVNAFGCNSNSVFQYFASALFALAEMKSIDLNKITVGIVGVGNIGKKVEKFLKILGVNLLLNDPPRERVEGKKNFVNLNELIEGSDLITFHVPLNVGGIDNTYHLLDENFIREFISSKIIFNTSRGEVIDTPALKKAIIERKVSAAVLDVWENEPRIDRELLNLVDIATPHIAGYSIEGKFNSTLTCIMQINDYFNLKLNIESHHHNLPIPPNKNIIEIDCSSKNFIDIVKECVLHSYDVRKDDEVLRNSVETFEQQRINHPVRREFSYYQIVLQNATHETTEKLVRLGFSKLNK